MTEAQSVCRTWLAKEGDGAKAEAHKCLANVFVHQAKDRGGNIMISSGGQRLALGGMAGPPRFSGKEMVQAIEHLDKAAELSPADLSIHQGRLFLSLASGHYERGVASLELSTAQFEGASSKTWLEYMGHFPRSEKEQAAAFAEVIVRAHPESASALVELGSWQALGGDTANAKASLTKASLTKAIAASPNDAMAHWRMGELLEQEGNRTGALAAFRKSLSLDGPLAEERQSAYERSAEQRPSPHKPKR